MRGELEDGSVIEVDIRDLAPADELRAWAAGRRTVAVRWRNAIELRTRTDRDRRIKPAGYAEGRIWIEHDCPATTRQETDHVPS